jgi:poly(A) polymerase
MAVEANKKLKEEEKKPSRIITGHDLIALGLTPGPIFSQILKEIEDMQLEGSIKNKNQALDFIKKKYLS